MTDESLKKENSIDDAFNSFRTYTQSLLSRCFMTDNPDSFDNAPRISSAWSRTSSKRGEKSTVRSENTHVSSLFRGSSNTFTAEVTTRDVRDSFLVPPDNPITQHVVLDGTKDKYRRYDTNHCITLSLHGVPKFGNATRTCSRLSFVADYRGTRGSSEIACWEMRPYWEIRAYGFPKDLDVMKLQAPLCFSEISMMKDTLATPHGITKDSSTEWVGNGVERICHRWRDRRIEPVAEDNAEEKAVGGITEETLIDIPSVVETAYIPFIQLVALRSLINTLSKKNKEQTIETCGKIGFRWVNEEALMEVENKLEVKVKNLMGKSTPSQIPRRTTRRRFPNLR